MTMREESPQETGSLLLWLSEFLSIGVAVHQNALVPPIHATTLFYKEP